MRLWRVRLWVRLRAGVRRKRLVAPVKAAATPASYRRKPPKFAEHREEILSEAGFSADDISALTQKGITPDKRNI